MHLRYLVLFLWCLTSIASGDNAATHVVGVTDGDTITILDADREQHKVRLAGIDAPEKKQPFGQRSKEHLSDLVFGKDVTLVCGKIDRYSRDICVVYIGGKDANLAQVEAGLAWWYRKYAKEQTPQQRVDYEAAETRAKAARRGLWADAEPVPPWEWRHR
ncbi:MAG: thermonuclease family protein [Gammaproteobacteria bacterium]|nr:thermonuclease family protein [Gammaproteobacteria bacterium]MBU1415023.1 thermonuclease family protein [Gammaproteobacteria bacterium]